MKEKYRIDAVNPKNEKNREDIGSLKSKKPSDDNSLVEELEHDLVSKNTEIIELQKRLEDAQERIHDVIILKGSLEKQVNDMKLKELSLKFAKCNELKNDFKKLEHRMQITKEQLDEARNLIKFQEETVINAENRVKFMEKVIEDLENRGLTDYLRRKFPETFIEYKKE
jgi:chromosome segregation ATPase